MGVAEKNYNMEGVNLKVGLASSFFGHKKLVWVTWNEVEAPKRRRDDCDLQIEKERLKEANPIDD